MAEHLDKINQDQLLASGVVNENTSDVESEIRKLLAEKINITEYSLGMSHSVAETKKIL